MKLVMRGSTVGRPCPVPCRISFPFLHGVQLGLTSCSGLASRYVTWSDTTWPDLTWPLSQSVTPAWCLVAFEEINQSVISFSRLLFFFISSPSLFLSFSHNCEKCWKGRGVTKLSSEHTISWFFYFLETVMAAQQKKFWSFMCTQGNSKLQ